MEFNAEQIRYKMSEKQIKTALKCLSKPNSTPVDREKCYFMWKEPSCFSCYHEVAQNALALINSQEQRIKELTEENERLKAEISVKKKLLDKCVDLEDKVRADTVRKMQRHIEERLDISADGYSTEEVKNNVFDTIDQIAKEMLERKDESNS